VRWEWTAQTALGKTEGGKILTDILPLDLFCFVRQELLPDLFCVCYSTHISKFNEVEDSVQ